MSQRPQKLKEDGFVWVRTIYGKGPQAAEQYNFIPSGGVNDLLKSWHAKQEQRKYTVASPSSILTCPRVVWLKSKGVEDTNPMTWAVQQRLMLGRLTENLFAKQFHDEGLLLYHWKDSDSSGTKVEKPGFRSSEYQAWTGMKQRCGNPNYHTYKHYGARGISFDPRWQWYENFIQDMGAKPSPNHSLDRIDNDGNYTPENCRWATRKQQMRNRRTFKNNTSGQSGVVRERDSWRAQIRDDDGKMVNLGIYKDLNEAIAVRSAAETEYWGAEQAETQSGYSVPFTMGERDERLEGTPDFLLQQDDFVLISDAKTSRSDSYGYVPVGDSIWEEWNYYRMRLQLTAYHMLCHSNEEWFKRRDFPLPSHCHIFSYSLDDGLVRREMTWEPTQQDMAAVRHFTRQFNNALKSETMPDCTCPNSTDGFEVKFCRLSTPIPGKKIAEECCQDFLEERIKDVQKSV